MKEVQEKLLPGELGVSSSYLTLGEWGVEASQGVKRDGVPLRLYSRGEGGGVLVKSHQIIARNHERKY